MSETTAFHRAFSFQANLPLMVEDGRLPYTDFVVGKPGTEKDQRVREAGLFLMRLKKTHNIFQRSSGQVEGKTWRDTLALPLSTPIGLPAYPC